MGKPSGNKSRAAAQVEATQHLGFALQFAIEALRFGEGPALACRLMPMLPPLLQLQASGVGSTCPAAETRSAL
jgi:hypothetical protein